MAAVAQAQLARWPHATMLTLSFLKAGVHVACQGDGTTWLPEGRDHRGALLRMLVVGGGVNCSGSGALSVGRSFDDEGVRG